MRTLEDNAFLLLIIAVSLAFAWILLPFYGAVLWGIVIAILCPAVPAAVGVNEAEAQPRCLLYGLDRHCDSNSTNDADRRVIDAGSIGLLRKSPVG